MKDEEISIKVYRGLLDENRYTVYATYINDPFKSGGEAYVEDNFITKLFGVTFDEQLKTATCEAIRRLKSDYAYKKEKSDYLNSLEEKARSYVKKCPSGDKND